MDEHHMNQLDSSCESDVYDNIHTVTPFWAFLSSPNPSFNLETLLLTK